MPDKPPVATETKPSVISPRHIRLIQLISGIMAVCILVVLVRYIFFRPVTVFADSTIGMNEGQGTTIHDNNGNISGTITNAVWKPSQLCKVGTCLYFDGTGDYVSFGNDADVDFATGSFTVEGWFRTPDITSGTRVLVAKYNSATGTDGGYKVYMDSNGYLNFGIDNNQTSFPSDSVSTTTTAFDDNEWHHFAAVKTSTTSITLFVDGNQYQTDSSITASSLTNTDAFYAGIDGDGSSNGFSGFLDEIKVYSTAARTGAQVKSDFNSATATQGSVASFGGDQSGLSQGLVGYWKMDETSGNAADSSGNGLTLTNNGTTGYASGKFGNASGSFNGTSQYFSTATSVNSVRTVSFWVYPGSTTTNYLNLASGKYLTSSSGTLTATGFTNPIIYVNGVVSSTIVASVWQLITITDDTGITANSIRFGQANGAYFASGGYLDEIRLYNRTLAAAEILQLSSWGPGPVAYWNMDEGSWTNNCSTDTVMDSTGNVNHAHACPASTGPTGGVSGKFGKGGYFDGNDDYLSVPDMNTLDGVSQFTISYWANVTSFSAWSNFFTKSNGTNDRITIQTGASSGELYAIVANGANTDGHASSLYNVGEWFHTSIVYNGNASSDSEKLKVYINGVSRSLTYDGPIPATTDSNAIGESIGQIAGYMDELKVYTYARSATQVLEDMNAGRPIASASLGSSVGQWKFDEGGDNSCSGQSNDVCNSGLGGTALDGAQSNMAVPPTATSGWTTAGKFGKALVFDGSDDVISLGSNTIVDDLPATGLSISTWIYPTSVGENSAGFIMAKNSGTTPSSGWILQLVNTNAVKFSVDGSTDLVSQSVNSAITLNAWNHIVLSWDGGMTTASSVHMYVNGSEVSYATQTNGASRVSDAASTLYIGNDSTGARTFSGSMDEVYLYNVAIDARQVRVLYNGGTGTMMGGVSTDSSGNPTTSNQRETCPPDNTETNCGSGDPSPVAYWKFDENTGSTAVDSSSRGNSGTITAGSGQYMGGKVGSGYNFDGASTVVNAGSGTTLDNLPASGMTVEAWIYPRSAGENTAGFIVAKNVGTTPSAGWILRMNSTTSLTFTVDGSTDLVHTTNTAYVTQNAWNHVVVTWDGVITTAATAKIYINGVEAKYATTTNGASRVDDGTSTMYIGNDSTGARTFDGIIDDVRIFNYARSITQVSWDFNHGAPLMWWKMDESSWTNNCSTNTIFDSSGNGQHGVSCPNSTGATGGAAGQYGNAGNFDGTDDYALIADANIQEPKQVTVSLWVNPDIQEDFDRILQKHEPGGTNTDVGYGLRVRTSGQPAAWYYPAGSGSTITKVKTVSTSLMPNGSWTLLTMTFDGTTMKMFVNGEEVSTTTDDDTAGGTNSGITIGARSATQQRYDGKVDDVRIYGYPLTATQIRYLYNGNKPFMQFGE